MKCCKYSKAAAKLKSGLRFMNYKIYLLTQIGGKVENWLSPNSPLLPTCSPLSSKNGPTCFYMDQMVGKELELSQMILTGPKWTYIFPQVPNGLPKVLNSPYWTEIDKNIKIYSKSILFDKKNKMVINDWTGL